MKTILNLVFLAYSSAIFAQKFDKVADYHNYFTIEFNNVQRLNVQYIATMVHGTDEQIAQARQTLHKSVDVALKKYDKVTIIPQDQGFRLSAINAMEEFKASINTDYKDAAVKKAGCSECFERVLYEREFNREESKRANEALDKMEVCSEKFTQANKILVRKDTAKIDSLNKIAIKVHKYKEYSEDLKLVVAQVEYNWEGVYEALKNDQIEEAKKAFELLKIALPKAQSRLATIKKIPEDKHPTQSLMATTIAFLAYQTQCVEKYFPQILSCFDANNQFIESKITGYNNVKSKIVDQFNSTHGAFVDAYNDLRRQSINPELKNDPKLEQLPKEKNSSTQK